MPGSAAKYPGGEVETMVIADPAAGADWSVVVPDAEVWLVRTVKQRFVGDGSGGYDRDAILSFETAGGGIIARSSNAGAARISGSANTTSVHSLSAGNISTVCSSCYPVGLPYIMLSGGQFLRSLWGNLAGGDTLIQIRIQIEKWRF